MSTKHINANHIINIEGHSFKADDHGMWNLTEIWKTLGLPRGKAPSEWRTKEAKRFSGCPQKMRSLGQGVSSHILANKQVTLRYAGWVSYEFEDMVYSAFESILAMPEVQTVVANKMVELGYKAEAELLERHTNADRDYALREFNKLSNRLDGHKPERLYKAVVAGHIDKEKALSLIPVSSVWHSRLGGLD
ncbi:hypothetical protein JEP66_04640 [Proteus mirabilis]|uniref:hypothetical protein n=1 Tax=Proteus mirabilis TaxID=584 RepID=UPI001A239EED|nr:hypothetical protein [Proteus mirabilis]EKU6440737.1 hypothetical protein [Proteus mirabilis]EKU6778490.1 hypothetical protein [Proteus mirabilis]EKU7262562.1 hypothetical protein [Proteus mirabilis]EKV5076187.1 hypothetical protein [Proteus mirabilis]EKX6520778.1 hypothetical protein [Proteus mirabilis]